jgi:hypothetical protein
MPRKSPKTIQSLKVKVIAPTHVPVASRQLARITGGMLVSSVIMATLLTYFSKL